jgi:hypothetical protein
MGYLTHVCLTSGKELRYPWNRRPSGSPSLSGKFVEEKNLFSLLHELQISVSLHLELFTLQKKLSVGLAMFVQSVVLINFTVIVKKVCSGYEEKQSSL